MPTDNERRAVFEVQDALRYISFSYPSIPEIQADGIFGPETTGAVRAFQDIFSLPVTGEVDLITWNTIMVVQRDLQDYRAAPRGVPPVTNGKTRIGPGDEGDTIILLQVMLRRISTKYINIGVIELTGVFDAPTQEAVRQMQAVSDLYGDGIVNTITWNSIVGIYETV